MTSPSGVVGRNIRPPKTGELIAAQLRARIVSGQLAPGDALPSEIELMEQFDVSRPTLREAFRILETESLIVIKRGSRGARVVPPRVEVAARYFGVMLQVDGVSIGDVYQARAVIEPAAVGMLAAGRTAQDLEDLQQCVDALEAVVDAGGDRVDAWAEHTHRFHELLVDRSGNRTLALQSRVLSEVVATHLSVAVQRTFDADQAFETRQFRRVIRSYRKLIGLLEARDAPAAMRHWTLHMREAGTSLLRNGLGDESVLDLFEHPAPR